jgi:hypothetical protein
MWPVETMPAPPQSFARKHERVSAARVLLRIPTVDRLRSHYLKDLSEGGAFVRLREPMPVGALVMIELQAPWLEGPLQLRSRVVRVVEPDSDGVAGMAVKFEALDETVSAKLRGLIDGCRNAPPEAGTETKPAGSAFAANVERLRSEMEAVQSLARAEKEIAVREQERLQEELETARQGFALALKERIALDERDKKRLEEERDAVMRERDRLSTVVAGLKRERDAIRSERDKAQAECDSIRERLNQANDAVEDRERVARGVERRLADAKRESDRLRQREAELRRFVHALANGQPGSAPDLGPEAPQPLENASWGAAVDAATPPAESSSETKERQDEADSNAADDDLGLLGIRSS